MILFGIKNIYKKEFIFIFLILLNILFLNEIFASKKRSIISGIEVKVYKKEKKHIETSALLCALAINSSPLEEIKKNLQVNFQNPISKSDKFLINDVMKSMCPEIDNRKFFEN